MKEYYKGKRKIHAFSADAYENFALYVPKEESNSLENAKFYGDVEKYNYLENNQIIDIWENDFNMAQIVVLMNEEFDSLSVELENEDKLDDSLKIEYGFNEFVYSSDYKLTNGMANPFGIKQTLLVPEKVTDNKEIDKVYKNTVYIINVSVYSTLIKQSQVKELKFKIAGKKDGKTLIEKNSINLNIFSINYDNYKQSDYNLFYFPEWTSFYYNSVFVNKDSKKNYGRPDFIKDEYDFNEYIDFNWDLYWKNEYDSLSKLGMDSFQLRMDDYWNSNWNDKRDFHNPWTIRRKSLNFIPWRYKGSFDTKNWKKELITFDEIKNGLEIKKDDWN
ncbi:hypothetical protein [Spiroplasma endosymbiont of Atherix ibis]|uniref:hypothetical protein n=1 Tax=Spiroplasma endosymbiont of Atherix ibis TaxID=3066291 RepID=UPI0030CF17B6